MAKLFKLGIFPWNWKPFYFSIVYFIFSCIGLFMPGSDLPESNVDIPFLDKALHFTIFGGMVFSFLWDNHRSTFKSKSLKVAFAALMLFMAFFSEYAQGRWLNRTSSNEDIIADLLGVIAGYFFYKFICNRLPNRHKD